MPDEDKNFGGCLVLDFRKWWRHVKTIYTLSVAARSIEFPLKFGKHWIPETIFLKYTELTTVVLAGKAYFICKFRLQQYKSDLARKEPRAAIFVLVFGVLSLAPLSRVFLTRDARWWSTPRARKLVPATSRYSVAEWLGCRTWNPEVTG